MANLTQVAYWGGYVKLTWTEDFKLKGQLGPNSNFPNTFWITFSVAAPKIWNTLPPTNCSSPSTRTSAPI